MSFSRVTLKAAAVIRSPRAGPRLGFRGGFKFSSSATLPVLPLGPRLSSTMTDPAPSRRIQNQVIFVCDLQDKFRDVIWHFDKILLTTQKVLRAAQILGIPVVATTQKARRLGGIVPELQPLLEKLTVLEVDKTLFSMLTPEVLSHELFSPSSASASFTSAETSISTLSASSPPPPRDVVIVGIESHICVTQTVVDLLARGHRVRVLADGVSSCHPEEVPLALARLRADGAVVTSSESWLYETMGDADVPEFRDIARIVRESSANTKSSLAALLSSKI